MASSWVVPSFDELEDDHTGLGLGLEFAPGQEFAFERGEEALAHGVVVGVADRSDGWTDTGFLTSRPEGNGCVLRSLIRVANDIPGPALADGHV